jgi:hypothetical protein
MGAFKMKRISFMLIVLIAILGIFLTGCSETTVRYQCQDGSFVDSAESCAQVSCQTNCPEIDYSQCPQTKCPDLDCSLCSLQIKEVTKYQCSDGTIKDKISDCSSVAVETEVNNKNEPDLSITINSASTTTRYLHQPTITISNEGGAVDKLVYDVELYKSSKLIVTDTDVLYKSGSTSIRSIDSGDSVKGYLNVMIYSGNTEGFTTGTHTLKVIVRRGASATPLATAEKQVTFS